MAVVRSVLWSEVRPAGVAAGLFFVIELQAQPGEPAP